MAATRPRSKASKSTKASSAKVDMSRVAKADLIIAEKNIAARKLAELLAEGKVKRSKLRGIDVYEIDYNGRHAAVIGLRGHIVELTYPKRFASWQRVPLEALVEAEPERTLKERGIASALQELAKGAERIVLATDYDREGELIGVEALEQALEACKARPPEVKRARFSAFTPSEIQRAFASLAKVDKHLADSAHARQIVDLAWGAVLTRFISLASGQLGEDFLSVGRVQSPTLAVLVDKEKEIRAFKPSPYWEITARLRKRDEFTAQHVRGRWESEAEAQAVHARLLGAQEAEVVRAEKRERRERAPEPFDTTAFLAAATRLGIGAARAMGVAENLYVKGFISYPRTDNTQYPPSLPLRDYLQKLAKAEELGHLAERILEQPELKPTRGKKTDPAHPPITPTEAASRRELEPDEWRVYELVARRFLATLAPDARLLNLKVLLKIREEDFEASGLKVVEPGWRAYYPYTGAKQSLLPDLQVGDRCDVLAIDLERKVTQPPKRISQGKLLELMEQLGLGTKSTRHEIIQKLYARGYIQSSPPQPAESAFAVVEALERHAPHIAKPDMTAQLEREMDEIAAGQKPLGDVVEESKRLLREVLAELEANRDAIGKSVRDALRQQAMVGRCPTCGQGLMVRRARTGKRFLGCSGYPACTQTYPLPQYGKLVKMDQICAACDAPVVKLVQARRRPWLLCVNMQCPNQGKELAAKPAPWAKPVEEAPREPVPELEALAEAPSTEEPTEVEERAVE